MQRSLVTLALIASLGWGAVASAGGWSSLATAAWEETETEQGWLVRKYFPDTLRNEAADFTITGFLVPVVPEPELSNFLLVETRLDCPYCGESASPTSVLEVELAAPIAHRDEFSRITVRGKLEFIENTMTTQLFRLTEARPVD